MESSSWIALLVLGTIVAYLAYALFGSKKAIRKSPEQLILQFPELDQSSEPALIYCFGPNCSACRAMSPRIEAVSEKTGRVFMLDVSEHTALAKKLGIRVIPSTLVFKEGRISSCLLGLKSETKLRKVLQL